MRTVVFSPSFPRKGKTNFLSFPFKILEIINWTFEIGHLVSFVALVEKRANIIFLVDKILEVINPHYSSNTQCYQMEIFFLFLTTF